MRPGQLHKEATGYEGKLGARLNGTTAEWNAHNSNSQRSSVKREPRGGGKMGTKKREGRGREWLCWGFFLPARGFSVIPCLL